MRIDINGTTINTHDPNPHPESVTFHNVTVIISGCDDAVDAYNLLCTALAAAENDKIAVEWETDTYSTFTHRTGGGVNTDPAPTSDLFPESRRRDADTEY